MPSAASAWSSAHSAVRVMRGANRRGPRTETVGRSRRRALDPFDVDGKVRGIVAVLRAEHAVDDFVDRSDRHLLHAVAPPGNRQVVEPDGDQAEAGGQGQGRPEQHQGRDAQGLGRHHFVGPRHPRRRRWYRPAAASPARSSAAPRAAHRGSTVGPGPAASPPVSGLAESPPPRPAASSGRPAKSGRPSAARSGRSGSRMRMAR